MPGTLTMEKPGFSNYAYQRDYAFGSASHFT